MTLLIDDIFPLGIGTWGLGGFATRDQSIDTDKQIQAITHSFDHDQNFVEVNQWYSQGESAKIVARALGQSIKKREEVFLSQSCYLKDSELVDAENELVMILDQFGTDHVDLFQFTQGVFLRYGFEKCATLYRQFLEKKYCRYIGVTNEDLPLLQALQVEFGDKLWSHEVVYNLEIRTNERLGIIDFANKNHLKTIIYQPLRRGRTSAKNWPLLVELSRKYQLSQNQLLLNWLCSRGFLVLNKATTIVHIDDNLLALKTKITPTDLKRLDDFKPPSWVEPTIDWQATGEGVRIDQLSNVFDEIYQTLS